MNLVRFFVVLLLSLNVALMSMSEVRAELTEGRDYTVLLNIQPSESGNNIEVREFFWYGCTHCYDLHPYIKTWLKKIPKDVAFRYVPAIFRTNWIPGAKTFHTLEILGMREKLHDTIYDAIHIEKIDLTKDEILFDWIEKQGVDRKKFIDIYTSFMVQNQTSQSSQMSKNYSLSGVPSIVVAGRYLTSGRMGGTPHETIRILNELIEKVRAERKRK